MSSISIQPVIGLEIHVQLATRTKLFCGCRVEFGAVPNSRVCPVCLGLPGALPVLNASALELAVKTALALDCRIARFTKWDRKSYYYPDLPKNYQISQFDMPLATEGHVEFDVDGRTKTVRIRRAHLEEDAGKSLHDHPKVTQVDLNRAGTPLLEIVTEPDLASAEEAYVFCVELQRLVAYLGVSEAVMQKGQMRFEPNVNVLISQNGRQVSTPICEIKNLNSFRAIRAAIDFEIHRQAEAWKQDPGYTREQRDRENRGWNDARNETVFQRSKEEVHDYRYFPDPDLVPVVIEESWLSTICAEMPELPRARRKRLMRKGGLSAEDALQIVSDRPSADMFDAAVGLGAKPATLTKHFRSFWARHANSRQCPIAELDIGAERMAELAKLADGGRLSATAAATIAEKMLDCPQSPSSIAKTEGLELVQDRAAIEAMVAEAIEANPKAAQMVRGGDKKWKKSLGFLQGQVMQKSKGSASPQLVREILEEKLNVGGHGS